MTSIKLMCLLFFLHLLSVLDMFVFLKIGFLCVIALTYLELSSLMLELKE